MIWILIHTKQHIHLRLFGKELEKFLKGEQHEAKLVFLDDRRKKLKFKNDDIIIYLGLISYMEAFPYRNQKCYEILIYPLSYHEFKKKYDFKRILRLPMNFDLILTTHSTLSFEIKEMFGFNPQVAPLPVTFEVEDSYPSNHLYFADPLHSYYRASEILQIFEYQEDGFDLKIFGEGSEKIIIMKKLYENLNLLLRTEIIHFGESQLLNNFQGYCLISLGNEIYSPYTALIALSRGVPVITTSYNSTITEIIDDSYNGHILPYDFQQITEHISYLLHHPITYADFKKNALRSFLKYKDHSTEFWTKFFLDKIRGRR